MNGNSNETIVVMANGPSLRDVDFNSFKHLDTFGLNAAYRMYSKMNWWPTYHGCFDYVVCENHRKQYQSLIDDTSNNIKKFFYIKDFNKSPRFQRIKLSGDFNPHNPLCKSTSDFDYFHDKGNSGANACQVAICLGYKKIILLGADCNYKEIVDGAEIYKDNGANRLIISETINENPNYWFDDYQQPGDRYNIPNVNVFQKPGWESLASKCKNTDIDIVNCSAVSKLDCFRKSELHLELDV